MDLLTDEQRTLLERIAIRSELDCLYSDRDDNIRDVERIAALILLEQPLGVPGCYLNGTMGQIEEFVRQLELASEVAQERYLKFKAKVNELRRVFPPPGA